MHAAQKMACPVSQPGSWIVSVGFGGDLGRAQQRGAKASGSAGGIRARLMSHGQKRRQARTSGAGHGRRHRRHRAVSRHSGAHGLSKCKLLRRRFMDLDHHRRRWADSVKATSVR